MTTTTGTLDSRVLADIYRMHGRSVHKYLRTLTNGDAHLAEDILQETFLRAWRTPRLAHCPEAARPWLVTVARNLVVDRVRLRNRRPQEAGEAALAHLPTARCEISRVVDSITLADAMARLTPSRREVVVQMYLHGRSSEEVSAALGIGRHGEVPRPLRVALVAGAAGGSGPLPRCLRCRCLRCRCLRCRCLKCACLVCFGRLCC
ncbi:sigma-70 family RNA polymerase sigma factor [Lentzea sp. NPDC004782]|uniref:sigma-70 family RNA polymerase sigma factor n=1 Tax=Lentzea sp. NPDC004782 TaxID=3154458 RepID=UPI0033B7125A